MAAFYTLFILAGLASLVHSIAYAPSDYTLSPSFRVTDHPTLRKYDLVACNITGAPDGVERPVFVVNGQLPGPLIEVNSLDTLSIKVTNLLNDPLTIHWHGLHQNGSNWEDGVSGMTSCPIAPNSSYTYSFRLNGQYGTFWYHAHSLNLLADGVVGPLIVHDARDSALNTPRAKHDFVLHLSDWYHDTSDFIVNALNSPGGYNGTDFAPPPHSGLINGVGRFDCPFARPGQRCRAAKQFPEFVAGAGSDARFRLIAGTSHAMFHFSVDEHELEVIEADATLVNGPKGIQRVPIWGGQRYSAMAHIKAEDAGKSFWIRATMNLNCFNWLAAGLQPTTYAILRVPFANGTLPTGLPTTQDWPFAAGSTSDPTLGPCYATLESWQLPPAEAKAVPTRVAGRHRYQASFVRQKPDVVDLGDFEVNRISSMTRPWKPLLHDLLPMGQGKLANYTSHIILPKPEWYDIVIVNGDPIPHPFHLHALDSHIVAQGPGSPTDAELDSVMYNTTNPVKRDTLVVNGPGWAVLRVLADIPGVWFLHCHIGWHLSIGFAGVVVVQPDAIRKFAVPRDTLALCDAAPANGSSLINPGRRSLLLPPPGPGAAAAASRRAIRRKVASTGGPGEPQP